ncbi:hypothetical protein O9993_05680 [Vibrio lentus]|nr:hypothetical protein [Vibrio lentus]
MKPLKPGVMMPAVQEGNGDGFHMVRLKCNLYSGGADQDRAESAAYQLNKAKDLRKYLP